MSTQNWGFIKFNDTTFQHFTKNNSALPNDNVFGIDADTSNNIWLSTLFKIVRYNYVNNEWQVIQKPEFQNSVLWFLKYDKQFNTKWISAFNQVGLIELSHMNNDTVYNYYNTSNSPLFSNDIRDIEIDNNGDKYIGKMLGGINKFNSIDSVWNNILNPNSITCLLVDDSSNTVWFGTPGGGLGKLVDQSILTYYTPENSPFPCYGVTSICKDSSNNVLIGSACGLFIHNPSGVVSIENGNTFEVEDFILEQNYPNPFNPITKIKYLLPLTQNVKIKIVNVEGKEVWVKKFENQSKGYHSFEFDGSNLSSGVYFCVIKTQKYNSVIKMLLIK